MMDSVSSVWAMARYSSKIGSQRAMVRRACGDLRQGDVTVRQFVVLRPDSSRRYEEIGLWKRC